MMPKTNVGQKLNRSNSAEFSGTYILQMNKNYESYLKAIGMGWVDRKKTNLCQPQLVIEQNSSSQLHINVDIRGINRKIFDKSIVIGEEQTDVLPSGEKVQAVTVQEGDCVLITRLRRNSGEKIEIRQEFSLDGMTYVIRMEDLVAVRYFKRVSA